ncbi:DMT family transporter [Actinoallomurus sp. NPDC052274]|uniref:DMT family transporter n=1 Tax=Actinoallomurus sp. NPDC052274 TaxID=3155420 RepID=UPI00342DF56C
MNLSPTTDAVNTAEAVPAAGAARPVIIATLSGMAAVFMWGLAPVATRAAVAQLAPLPLTVLRAMMAGLACLPWCVSGLRRLDRAGALRAIAAGLLGMVGYNLPVALGVQWLPASTAALVLATEPIWILALARVFLGRRTSRRAWIGSAVALGGVAVIAGPEAVLSGSGARPLEGLGLVLLGTLLFGACTIVLRPLSTLHGPRTATAISTTIGAVPYLTLAGTVTPRSLAALPSDAWIELIFLALGTSVAGMLMWNLSVARIGSTQAGLLLFLEPLVGVTGSLALLGEHLTSGSLIGGALVMAGVVTAWTAQRHTGQA